MSDPMAIPEVASLSGVDRANRQGFLDSGHVSEIMARYVRGTKWRPGNRAELAAEYGVSEREIGGAANGSRCTVTESKERCPRVGRIVNGLCPMHLRRAQENGSPLALRRKKRLSLADLRAAAASTTDECLIPDTTDGRAEVRLNGVKMAAARAVWIIADGDPGDAWVLHRCNGGSGSHGCINRRHLYLGDAAQNHEDMDDAGNRALGEDHGNALLTNEQAAEIRRRYVRGTGPYNRGNAVDLAEEFGVHRSVITAVARGASYSRQN